MVAVATLNADLPSPWVGKMYLLAHQKNILTSIRYKSR
jgi:hypothetical protein